MHWKAQWLGFELNVLNIKTLLFDNFDNFLYILSLYTL
jgi:hypothetical protein